ncbi:Phage integrase, N-terminal SAM-like domain, partial [Streptomyces sp. MnatMP-M17]
MEGWQEQAAPALLSLGLPAVAEDLPVLLADRDPSLVQLRFPFQQLVITEVGELGGSRASLTGDLVSQQVARDRPVVLARLRLLANEDTTPLDRLHESSLPEVPVGVLRGGVGDREPLLDLTDRRELGTRRVGAFRDLAAEDVGNLGVWRATDFVADDVEQPAKLTEKIAASNRGLPVPSAQGSLAAYLTYWLQNVAIHHLRENTHTRYATCVDQYLIPGLGKKKLTKLTAKDVRTWLNQLRTTCQCCNRGLDARRDQPRCCAAGQCCHKLLSPLTLTYVHSVQVRPGARRPRGGDPAQRRPQ